MKFDIKKINVSEWITLIFLISFLTLISGIIIGEKLQSDYFGRILNDSANSNLHLIRTDNIYYSIHNYNPNNFSINDLISDYQKGYNEGFNDSENNYRKNILPYTVSIDDYRYTILNNSEYEHIYIYYCKNLNRMSFVKYDEIDYMKNKKCDFIGNEYIETPLILNKGD